MANHLSTNDGTKISQISIKYLSIIYRLDCLFGGLNEKMFLVVKLMFFKDKGDNQKSQPRKRGVKSYENDPKLKTKLRKVYAETTAFDGS